MTARSVRRLADWFYATSKWQADAELKYILEDLSTGLHVLARLLEQRDIEI